MVIIFGFCLILYRHGFLVHHQQSFLLKKSHARTERALTFTADKGQMMDRNGQLLAVSLPYYRFAIDPRKHDYNKGEVKKLASILGDSFDRLWQKIEHSQGKKYILISNRLTDTQVKDLMALSWEGLIFENRRGRYYPMGESASTLVGYVDLGGKGQIGMEYQFDQYIDGKEGTMSFTQNLLNQVTQVHAYHPPIAGKCLTLTIDRRLQKMAYDALKDAVDYHDAEYASAVILSSRTGEVLALANYPSFDPNIPMASLDERVKNHAISDLFEPGSIIKPLALASALEKNQHNMPTSVDTHGGSYTYLGQKFQDHQDLGEVEFEDILLKSSNIAMVKLVSQMPENTLIQSYQKFGLFSPLFVQLPGESRGTHVDHPTKVDEAAMSYGYGLSVNLLAMARAYNILANSGEDFGVHLVFEKHRPKSERVVSAKTVKELLPLMVKVTEQGVSSHKAKVNGVSVAGKSGTSHLLGESGQYENSYVATFAGFAPSEDPEIVVTVMVYKPKKHGHYGGQVAAPIFSSLLSRALEYVPKENVKWT
ncbi:peptidoglycan D,D-transpeptidase FtsI family protein [Candidatus Synchoanobacter obligatus]|uniref:Penicillin-binding protein 2 n=1 Tax=Candidatus Synchoanobacter obligatus TaxID=2919597 RepID=A0ABT1L6N8_9GAMM|nr:penicillin-binding protein 2 [Candidatus Synchoanobacter obligatus]MCP8352538.1 penicillin-binding protein 2 [Candidatus Synchoanobacter obligatus]